MTTTIARIVERFTMELDADPGRGEWFLDYVLRSPRQAGRHLTASWKALCDVAELYPFGIRSCREYFGGMGAQALMVQELFKPGDHTVLEYSEQAVRHLSRVLPHPVMEIHADSYDPGMTRPADLVMLDFGDMTVWKTREGEKHRSLLDRVFALEPRAVVITDIACRYLHLHRERYETVLGVGNCGSYDDYLVALSRLFEREFGYTLIRGWMDRWSTVMSWVPAGEFSLLPREFVETPGTPVGLELF